jgi:hypothetical protein
MISKLSVVASVTLVLAASAFGGEAGAPEVKEVVELRPGASRPIDPLKLTTSTLFDIAAGDNRVLLRVTPDGFMQFVETGVRVTVTVRGQRKNTVGFELEKGELVSVWPLMSIELIAGDSDLIKVDGSSPDWAFVVRAEKVRKGGLPALVDGNPVTLAKGQRLDASVDPKSKEVVFLQTGQSWPGKVVTMPAVAEHVREQEVPTIVVVASPSLPGVLLDREREFPWQTIPLPVIAWEVFRPPDVSR